MSKTTQAFKLIIFDWDGTLFNSEHQICAAIEKVSKQLNLPQVTKDHIKAGIGLSGVDQYHRLFPQHPNQQTHFNDYYLQAIQAGIEEITPESLFPEVVFLLEALKSRGVQIAIATSCRRSILKQQLLMTGLDEHFEISICGDEAQPKPDPDMLFQILSKTQHKPHQALMVGDTRFDLDMASRAGLAAIGIASGMHTEQMLAEAKPLAILPSIKALAKHVL